MAILSLVASAPIKKTKCKSRKERHPLYQRWATGRRENRLPESWYNDFWLMVEELGPPPEDDYKGYHINYSSLTWEKNKGKVGSDQESKNKYMREYRKKEPERFKHHDLKKHYGISLEAYNTLLSAQANKCAVCRQPETLIIKGKLMSLAVDHNHRTKKVRGLLCCKCNQALGLLQENLETIENLYYYISEHSNG